MITSGAVPTILLADSSPLSRRMAGDHLAQLGYASATADSGPAAWTLLQSLQPPPALILADAGLAGYSGLELCRRVKAHAALAAIPVVVLLGAMHPEREPELAWADGVLRKPLSRASLRVWLDRYAPLTPRQMLRLALREAVEWPGAEGGGGGDLSQ